MIFKFVPSPPRKHTNVQKEQIVVPPGLDRILKTANREAIGAITHILGGDGERNEGQAEGTRAIRRRSPITRVATLIVQRTRLTIVVTS
ncbi:MAG: hypothetical protein LBP53_00345 [Candidatus Peribacteria bacterium]|nr:hypothetical protein [Candidatus Peribacteria bacterium]